MRHVLLTCIHHPSLRWRTKEVAANAIGQYNGARNIFFEGCKGASSSDTKECNCSPQDLRFAPEELERQKTEPLDRE